MLKLKANCECCDRDLPFDSADAMICTFECTFCRECVEKSSISFARIAAAISCVVPSDRQIYSVNIRLRQNDSSSPTVVL